MQKDIRIVIPSYNSSNTIIDCLCAIIKNLSFSNSWEIIVIDNGPSNNLLELLDKYPVTVLHRNNINSAAYARNEGAKGFNEGILVFIDSDVICENECIEQLITPVQNGICHATIGNYSTFSEGLSFSQKYKQLYVNSIYTRYFTMVKRTFWTAICSIRADVFHKIKGFDEHYKGANGEDQELGIRISKSNFKVLSVPQAKGHHRHRYTVFKIIQNDFKKGTSAIQNSLISNVPISDNPHARMPDMLAVIFSIMTICFALLHPFNSIFLNVTILCICLWFISRLKFVLSFLKNGGIVFFLKAIALMFFLDCVRFSCVIWGNVKYRIAAIPPGNVNK